MSGKKVFVTRSNFPESGIKKLQEKFSVCFYPQSHVCPIEYLKEYVKDVDAILCMPPDNINKDVLDASGSQLKIVATMSLGFDHIDVEECQAVFNRLLSFEVARVFYYDIAEPVRKVEEKGAMKKRFDDLLQNSDYVIVTCNMTEENKGMFDKKAFSLMKQSAVFINVSRGALVEQQDLIEALKNNQIRAAGIDVMYPEPLPKDHELLKLPNIVVTPHTAGVEETSLEEYSSVAAENIIRVLEDQSPLTPVS
ncbi:hypothetical protein TNIN_447391 [Trichonephila inaurata madagascariensis]|uniref:Uncharacterized protein n=1 Tax=Trichonephila inaurata madagascariensis TaxID=2747483 RepID=A0A8X6JVV2_9ARAC|nr:hypothetical protein TNIN_447391 [Trichonephila inaurata madagascariensis]